MIGTLRGILIVVDDDIEAGEKLPDGPLKKLSEGKYVTGEKKGKDAFQFWNTAVPLLLCNNDPSTADISYGMRRRIMIIPFDRTFKKSEIDATLWPTIQETEMSGVLNRLVGGYQRLRARKSRFKEPEAVRQAKEDWFINANPLMNFLKHKTRKVARSRIALALLYNAYVAWAGENGIKFVIQRNTLKRQLQQLNYNVANSNMGAVVVGLELLKGGRNA
jgi:putative DNA primase/helicase